jgi:hypothetical protein
MVTGEKAHFASASSLDTDSILVEFEGLNDSLIPQNLPQWKKWLKRHIIGWLSLAITFATSVFNTATGPTAEMFGVAREALV